MNANASWTEKLPRHRLKWGVPALLALLAIVAAGLVINANRRAEFRHPPPRARAHDLSKQSAVAPLNLIRPLTPDDAIKQNAERPFDAPPDSPAKKFTLKTDTNSRDHAVECLTQAVYYEAATEGSDGERAVAQVVLNRMRHPGFPSSVCGVVYQGSELPTGCQFTFTCDGALARTPVPALWTRARKIALDALAGKVFAAVGHSTHYHADYVLPYWADSLAKQVQIGHHIFYRLEGGLGSGAAFSQRYAGKEPDLPPPPSAIAVAAQAAEQAQALLNSGLSQPPPSPLAADAVGVAAAGQPKQALLADTGKGALIADHGATVPAARAKKRANEDCETQGSKQVLPATPNDLHAGDSLIQC